MRYTEQEYKSNDEDLLGAIVTFFLNLILAPYRFISEISSKIIYLGKESIEKLCLVSILILAGLIAWDCIWYILSGKIYIWTGAAPLGVKFVSLVVMVWVSLVLSKTQRTDYLIIPNISSYSDESVEQLQEDRLEEDIAQPISPVLSDSSSLEVLPEEEPLKVKDLIETFPLDSHELEIEDENAITEDLFKKFSSGPVNPSTEELEILGSQLNLEGFDPEEPFEDIFPELSAGDILSSLQAGDMAFKENANKNTVPSAEGINLKLLFDKGI